MGCMHSESCSVCDGTYAELESLRSELETATKERDQAWASACHPGRGACKIHCNCYNDIDYDKPGCQWCEILKDSQETSLGWVEDREKLRLAELQVDDYKELVQAAREMVKHQFDRHELGHCCRDYSPTETYKLQVALKKIDHQRMMAKADVILKKLIDNAYPGTEKRPDESRGSFPNDGGHTGVI